MATTIGRAVAPTDVAVAHLDGYGRRWNYGSLHLRGDWHHDGAEVTEGLVVSLGLVASDAESCNGVIVRVTADELAMLDWRERDYERTDVSDMIRLDGDPIGEQVMTYVPRAARSNDTNWPGITAEPVSGSRTGNSCTAHSASLATITSSATPRRRLPTCPSSTWSCRCSPDFSRQRAEARGAAARARRPARSTSRGHRRCRSRVSPSPAAPRG